MLTFYRFWDSHMQDGKPYLSTYTNVKETKHTYRVDDNCGKTHVIYKKAKKKWAYLSQIDAAEGYLFRKNKHVLILKAKLDSARRALAYAKWDLQVEVGHRVLRIGQKP